MIGWNHLVEIKRIEKLALIIFPPTHHARLPLMPIHQRNHGSRVVSTGVLQHYPPESRLNSEIRQVRKVLEPDVTQSFVAGSWTRSIGCRCRSRWSGRATLPTAEIGRVQLFSSCHALLGSGRLYSCTTSAKIEGQLRPNAANQAMLSQND